MAEDACGRSRLGRGLAALIGDVGEETKSARSARAASAACRSNSSSPIRAIRAASFSDAELDELAASIRERGIIQPIVVRPVRGATDAFEIIAGERRWRAAQRAGLHDVPVVVGRGDRRRGARARDHRERAARRSQSARRGDGLSGARRRVQSQPGRHRQDRRQEPQPRRQHAAAVEAVRAGEGLHPLRQAHRRPRAHADRPAERRRAGAEIVERGLNVRQVEAMARKSGKEQANEAEAARATGKDADTLALEKRVSDALGLQVSVDHRGGWGILQIHYRDLEQLDEVLRKLEGGRELNRRTRRRVKRGRGRSSRVSAKNALRRYPLARGREWASPRKIAHRYARQLTPSASHCDRQRQQRALQSPRPGRIGGRASSAASASWAMARSSRAAGPGLQRGLDRRLAAEMHACFRRLARPTAALVDREPRLVQRRDLAQRGEEDGAGRGAGGARLGELELDVGGAAGERGVDQRSRARAPRRRRPPRSRRRARPAPCRAHRARACESRCARRAGRRRAAARAPRARPARSSGRPRASRRRSGARARLRCRS